MNEAITIEQLNGVYTERNQCVALIARMAQALGYTVGKVVGPAAFCDASEEWNLVFVDLPSGQVSWHIHESEMPFFDFLPLYEGRYDGYDTQEKYRRVLAPLHSS